MLEKGAVVPISRIRLECVLKLKLKRILFRFNHRTPVFERLKKTNNFKKKEKKSIKGQTLTTQ